MSHTVISNMERALGGRFPLTDVNASREVFVTLSPNGDAEVNHEIAQCMLTLLAGTLRCVLIPGLLYVIARYLWGAYVTSQRDRNCPYPLPPGDFGIPFIGETLHMLLNTDGFFRRKREQYGDIYITHVLGNPTVRVIGAENVRHILSGEHSRVEALWPRSTRLLLGAGSLSHASGSEHVVRKKALMAAFSFEALSSYVPVISTLTRKYVNKWLASGRIYGFDEFRTLNFAVSCKVMLGVDLDSAECGRLMSVFDTFTSNIFSVPLDAWGFGFRKGKKARKVLLEKIDEIIQMRKQGKIEPSRDVLSIILDSNKVNDLTEEEIKDLCLELLFAGHGTTSSAESYLVYTFVKHPEVLRKVRTELMSQGLLSNDGPRINSSELTFHVLNQMSYLNNVIKEVLRVSPPVRGGYRKALETFKVGGFQVPKGWTVIYSITETHNTPGYFSKPDVFDPDRWNQSKMGNLQLHVTVDQSKSCLNQTSFLENQSKSISQTTGSQWKYIPFSSGKRACAGKDLARMMLKIFAIELLRSCEFDLVDKNTEFAPFPLPHPKNGMPLEISRLMMPVSSLKKIS